VGDLAGNAALIAEAARRVPAGGADLIITPELALLGYVPRDLLLNAGFIRRAWETLATLAAELKDSPPLLVGIAETNKNSVGRPLFNAAALLRNGKVERTFHKNLLPTYDVFDEDRYFEPATTPQILEHNGKKLGISICEDAWNDRDFWQRRRYHNDPIDGLAAAGVDAILNMSASPFSAGKQQRRQEMLGSLARKHKKPLVYVNQVGGNDDLVFDGRSSAFNRHGELIARGKAFESDLLIVEVLNPQPQGIAVDDFTPESEVWRALVLGTRDYVRKCSFSKVVLGLSGGIDSALTAAIAVEAVGKENVTGVLMPSRFSSQGSIDDALELAKQLGIQTVTLPITGIMDTFAATLKDQFAGTQSGVAEENLQARIRGNLLMAMSNKFNSLLLTTGNKSELSVGYCTLYGDMNGGLAVIADVPKTLVYRVSRWRNERGAVIPESSLSKAPSAELRPNQTDQDSLPPYDLLDGILKRSIELHQSADEIIAEGFDAATVQRVLKLVKNAEFKRKQAAPGIKVTDRAFGTGWRMPIARKE
jgi:NAD+ synthase (glutamine-hydrolysing)